MVMSLFSRLNCCFSGHDYSIKQSGGRVFLMCTTCGHRSPGFVLTGRSNEGRAPVTRPMAASTRLSPSMLSGQVARQ
jgi:hypothetical protein